MSPDCPPPPDRSSGYVWPLYSGYELFTANLDGSDLRQLTEAHGYDAARTARYLVTAPGIRGAWSETEIEALTRT